MSNNFKYLSLKYFLVLFIFSICVSACKDDEEEMEEEPMEENLKIRKDAKDLTQQEITDYVNAILILKATPSPYTDTLSYYDTFVRFHQMAVEQSKCTKIGVAHMNPAFPAWHRKMLILYEDALSEVSGKDIALPYWDWTDQDSYNATFSTSLMGGTGDPNDEFALNDGPFRKDNWQVNLFTISANYIGLNPHPWLVRNFGATIAESDKYPGYPVSLPTKEDIENCLQISTYDVAPWDCSGLRDENTSFRYCLEGFTYDSCDSMQAMHNIGHDFIAGFFTIPVSVVEMIPTAVTLPDCPGMVMRDTVPNNVRVGSMEPLDVSPNDPAFFMHHCFVDKLWADWQERGDNFNKYEPVANAPQGYKLNDQMYPYDLPLWQSIPQMVAHGDTPASMLNYKKLGYKYQ
jgi:tyrosinase